jgi:hypothetical protein
MELVSFVAVSPVAESICQRHIYGNIATTVSQCESSFELAVLGRKELIHYQARCQDGSPSVEGFLNAEPSKLKELSDQLRAVWSEERQQLDLGRLTSEKAVEQLALLISTFGVKEVKAASMTESQATSSNAVLVHFRMRAEVMKMVNLAATFHVTVSLGGNDSSLMKSVGSSSKAKGAIPDRTLASELQPFVIELVKKLHEHSEKLASFMASDTLKTAEILNAPTKYSIMHLRNWQCLAGGYAVQAQSFLVGKCFESLQANVAKLRTSCPQWQSFASDSKFDEAKLREFVKTFDQHMTKGLVMSLHEGLVKLISDSGDMHASSALRDRYNSAKLSAAKAAIQGGKDTLALREVGVLLCGNTDIIVRKSEVESLLQRVEKIGGKMPASVVKALNARALP